MNSSYLEQRLTQLGITDELNSFRVADDSPRGWHQARLFSENQHGDILIQYLNLEGTVATYEAGRHRTEKPYRVRRLAQPQSKRKYIAPSGAPTRIYHPPGIVQKFQRQLPIDTLVVVEGQFKAFKGWMHGLDIVGINGIWNFRKKGSQKLKDDLYRLIQTCQVRNLILLFDADALKVEYQAEENLTNRLWDFYRAVRACREILKTHPVDFYFSHLNSDLYHTAKGLDDLLCLHPGKESAVIEDFQRLSGASEFFTTLNLTDASLNRLKSHFYLTSVEAFYERYQLTIGEQPFIWNHGRYEFNEEEGKVELLKHPDAFKFFRIGTEYFKEIETVNSKGETNTVLKHWKKGEITQDYVSDLGLKRFMSWIEKYDDFANLPDHTTHFQKVIHTPSGSRVFNLYHPMQHQEEAGEWPHIEAFLKHVFGEIPCASGKARYLMGLDYLTILYRYPAHKLPILLLLNEQQGTGKSTFIFFLRELFGLNATFCGNDDLTDNFNSSWVTKLLALIDEGVIEKRIVWEKVKSYTTSPRTKLHGKGKDKVEVDLFVKFIFTSNDEDNCVPVSPNSRRVWAIKVPQFTGEQEPDLVEKMKAEIPAFLDFLRKREIVHPRRGQLWFEKEELVTPALTRLIRGSKSWLEKELRETIKERLLEYSLPEICLTYTDIETEVCKHKRYHRWEIIRVLRDKLQLQPENSTFLRYRWEGSGEHKQLGHYKDKGRFYRFRAQDFLSPQEQEFLCDLP